jgi:hypothetical protein
MAVPVSQFWQVLTPILLRMFCPVVCDAGDVAGGAGRRDVGQQEQRAA